MNSDTIRDVAVIGAQGWYRQGQTLGEGGWGAIYKISENWKAYELTILDDGLEPVECITAKDDATAIAAFHKLYRLKNVGYDISEKMVTFRRVETNLEPT